MDSLSIVADIGRGACGALLLTSSISKLSRTGRAERTKLDAPFSRLIGRQSIWFGLAVVEMAMAISVIVMINWLVLLAPTFFLVASGLFTVFGRADERSCGCYGVASKKVTGQQKRIRGVSSIIAAGMTWTEPEPVHHLVWTIVLMVIGAVIFTILVAELRILTVPMLGGLVAALIGMGRGAIVGRIRPAPQVLRLASGSQAYMVVAHLLTRSVTETETWAKGLRWRFLSWNCVINGADISANIAIYLPHPERSRAILVRKSDGFALLRI